MEWERPSSMIKGILDFRIDGKGVFIDGYSNESPFTYFLMDDKATFQFVNPGSDNTVHHFDVVISSDTLQVWEESSQYFQTTFILRKRD